MIHVIIILASFLTGIMVGIWGYTVFTNHPQPTARYYIQLIEEVPPNERTVIIDIND